MSAIEYTTAIGLVSMVELFVEKKIPQVGYIRQEDVEWKKVLYTKYGGYYRETEENIIGL
jgi:saccharopine dehydrogenase-like NADP-dependent oxidoreductase